MKSLSPTDAPRCQHTWIALLLRTDALAAAAAAAAAATVDDTRLVPVPTVAFDTFDEAFCWDSGVGDVDVSPHVSKPSSDEPVRMQLAIRIMHEYWW